MTSQTRRQPCLDTDVGTDRSRVGTEDRDDADPSAARLRKPDPDVRLDPRFTPMEHCAQLSRTRTHVLSNVLNHKPAFLASDTVISCSGVVLAVLSWSELTARESEWLLSEISTYNRAAPT